MPAQVTQCNVCLEKGVDCEPSEYNWNGLKFGFMMCVKCFGLLSFAALIELREERDDVFERLNKPKEPEPEPDPDEPTLEDYVENPPVTTIEIDPDALREALHGHETKTDD